MWDEEVRRERILEGGSVEIVEEMVRECDKRLRVMMIGDDVEMVMIFGEDVVVLLREYVGEVSGFRGEEVGFFIVLFY